MPKEFRSISQDISGKLVMSLRRYMGKTPVSAEELANRVRRYKTEVHQAVDRHPFVNTATSDEIAATLLGLIALIEPDMPDYERDLIQAAVFYYIDREDKDGDLESTYGFDDDKKVADAVKTIVTGHR